MKKILGLLFLTLFFGCNLTKHSLEQKSDCVKINFKTKFIDKDSLGIPYYQSDEFTDDAIKEYSIKLLKEKYSAKLKLTLIPFVNIYDSTIVDTIYKFSNNNNVIEVYRAKEKDFVINFDITDPIFKLIGCLSIGSGKDSVVKQFGIKENIGDTIVIGNMNQTATFTFYLKNNKIVRIGSYIYFE